MVDNCTRFVQALLFPATCVLCGAPGLAQRDLCRGCEADLPWLGPGCVRCARPLPESGAGLCGACLRKPPAFQRTVAAFHYYRPVDVLIRRLKFNQQLQYARLLGHLLATAVRSGCQSLPSALIPVPLHPRRQRQRGFNQAIELARPVGRILGIPLATNVCQRVRATDSQSLLNRRERHANLIGAFRLSQRPPAEHVAIIDDVMTTASTVQSLAQVLLAGGARQVDVWCVARADQD